jgi:hypothetical protein
MSDVEQVPGPEPPRPDPPAVRVWRYARPVLEVAAILVAYGQHRTLAVTVRVLVVLGTAVATWLVARRSR